MATNYTVRGRWPFPTDMLRYDEARAATPEDQALIDRLSTENASSVDDIRIACQINLVSNRSNYFLAYMSGERWNSFGWSSMLPEDAARLVAPAPEVVPKIVGLSDRIRAGSEAAPWVLEAVKRLEVERVMMIDALRAAEEALIDAPPTALVRTAGRMVRAVLATAARGAR